MGEAARQVPASGVVERAPVMSTTANSRIRQMGNRERLPRRDGDVGGGRGRPAHGPSGVHQRLLPDLGTLTRFSRAGIHCRGRSRICSRRATSGPRCRGALIAWATGRTPPSIPPLPYCRISRCQFRGVHRRGSREGRTALPTCALVAVPGTSVHAVRRVGHRTRPWCTGHVFGSLLRARTPRSSDDAATTSGVVALARVCPCPSSGHVGRSAWPSWNPPLRGPRQLSLAGLPSRPEVTPIHPGRPPHIPNLMWCSVAYSAHSWATGQRRQAATASLVIASKNAVMGRPRQAVWSRHGWTTVPPGSCDISKAMLSFTGRAP